MGIDTELKRRSTLGVLPTADGTIDGFDRRAVWWIYAGIATDSPLIVVSERFDLIGTSTASVSIIGTRCSAAAFDSGFDFGFDVNDTEPLSLVGARDTAITLVGD